MTCKHEHTVTIGPATKCTKCGELWATITLQQAVDTIKWEFDAVEVEEA